MLLCNENAIQAGGGYTISNSLRFQSASSQYLARIPASNGNRQIFTFSFWVKRGTLSSNNLYFTNAGGGTFAQIDFLSGDTLYFASVTSSVANAELTTTQVFRDPSAWYHIVYSVDTTQATAANRVKLYVNGTQVTAFVTATYPAQNYSFQLNTTTAQNIGRPSTGTFDGYMAEYNFIDGQALTPSSFGATTALTGQWSATKYTGTYGTNGFYLPFSNGTSTTTLGADSSGNSNNWILTSFTRSAGVSDCWMYDVPSGNGGASATQPSSNYCVMNPLRPSSYGAAIITKANLNTAQNTTAYVAATSTLPVNSGKWYWEVTCGVAGFVTSIGITTSVTANGPGATGSSTYHYDGTKYTGGVNSAYGASYTNGDVLGFALDLTAGTLVCYKNNASQGTLASSLTSDVYAYATMYGTNNVDYNFGNRSFTYTPPSGFKSLCTANLATTTIAIGNLYMDATLYTGNGSTLTVTNTGGFSPNLVWMKRRSSIGNNYLQDTNRGALNSIFSDSTSAEVNQAGTLTSFNSNGFSLGADAGVNGSASTYVGWQWKAGGTAVTNTSGSITSTVSAGTTQGFSVVTYTGTGANATVGHGLGVAPQMVIYKRRNSTSDWAVYHVGLTSAAYTIYLDLTLAQQVYTPEYNSTAPTSSVLSIGTSNNTNTSGGTYVAYCFAPIAGYSAFGSYTGNGSADGTFVYLGFRPKYVMIKLSSGAGQGWFMYDSSRNTYNVEDLYLLANSSAVEGTFAGLDCLSNGFKIRNATGPVNTSAATYIYACFAESPFASSNAR